MKHILPVTVILTLMTACSSSNGGTSQNDATPVDDTTSETKTSIISVLSVQVDGDRYDLSSGEDGFIDGEESYIINEAASRNGSGFGTGLVFEGSDVTIAAGTDTGSQPNFSTVIGTVSDAPSGSAQFEGHYSIADALEVLDSAQEHGAITLNFDLAQSTITGTSDNNVLVVNGDADSSGEITGSVTVDGSSADLSGGFFGTGGNEVAAGFTNDDFGGYVYGQETP